MVVFGSKPLSCDDDDGPACEGLNASVAFAAVANTPYYVLAGGYGGASGNLHITATAAPTPFNDTCTNAIPMTNSVVYSVNTDNATETSDPGLCCGYSLGRGVWYTFSPPITERVTITTCGSDFNTSLAVFTGICGTFGSNHLISTITMDPIAMASVPA